MGFTIISSSSNLGFRALIRQRAPRGSGVDVPVIASGGAGNYGDLVRVVSEAGAPAVACASIFHFTEQSPAGAKATMQEAGIPVRRNFVGTPTRAII
jgi:imidazole glycerol phosphate synthase subunit HisF